jgi:hypothetical protein
VDNVYTGTAGFNYRLSPTVVMQLAARYSERVAGVGGTDLREQLFSVRLVKLF